MAKIKTESFKSSLVLAFHPIEWAIFILLYLTIIGFIPVIIYTNLRRAGHEAGKCDEFAEDVKKRFIDYLGGSPEYIDFLLTQTSWHPPTYAVTALALKSDTLYILRADNTVGTIPWQAVRSWRWTKEGYDVIQNYGVPRSQQAAVSIRTGMANNAAKAEAEKNSGIFVKVADVDYPEWQFQTVDAPLMKRWHEIFTQQSEKMKALA